MGGGGGGGKGSAPVVTTPATPVPPAPVRTPVDPEAKDTTVQVEDSKAKKAAAAKKASLFADAETLGQTAAQAGSVFSRTLGG